MVIVTGSDEATATAIVAHALPDVQLGHIKPSACDRDDDRSHEVEADQLGVERRFGREARLHAAMGRRHGW